MKAVVVEGPNQVSYQEVEAPVVGADDVLVQSREAGLCRTDIEVITGAFTDPRWVHFPVIPGHEWAGTVVEIGGNVSSVRAGDRVVCEGLIPCNRLSPLPERRDAMVRADRGAWLHSPRRLRRARLGTRAGRAPLAGPRLLRRRRARRAGVGSASRP
ncbi:MAG: alcohol dehydrogenase catalytic domain-containing protein [Solirubrobacteraceae bacterium]